MINFKDKNDRKLLCLKTKYKGEFFNMWQSYIWHETIVNCHIINESTTYVPSFLVKEKNNIGLIYCTFYKFRNKILILHYWPNFKFLTNSWIKMVIYLYVLLYVISCYINTNFF